MKKLFCILLGLGICFIGNAQDKAEETKEKAKQRAENRVDNKIDNAIEGGLDKLEGLFKKKNKKKKGKKDSSSTTKSNNKTANPGFNMGNMFGGGKKIDIRPNYEFGSDMKVEISSIEKGKEDKTHFSYFFPKDKEQNYLGIKPEIQTEEENGVSNAFTIIDEGVIISFVNQNGMKMSMPMEIPDAEEKADETSDEDDFFGSDTEEVKDKMNSIKKTGNTKTILGYKCEEYLMEDDEAKINIWVAPSLGDYATGMTGMFHAFQKKGKTQYNPFQATENNGMVLEMTSLDKKANTQSTMKTIEINVNKDFNFRASEYPQMNISEMMKNAGKE